MKVAWHEMPGNTALGSPARRARYDGFGRTCERWTKLTTGDHTVPYGTDHLCPSSRHFMPGYLHSVPPGQIADHPGIGADTSCPIRVRRHHHRWLACAGVVT